MRPSRNHGCMPLSQFVMLCHRSVPGLRVFQMEIQYLPIVRRATQIVTPRNDAQQAGDTQIQYTRYNQRGWIEVGLQPCTHVPRSRPVASQQKLGCSPTAPRPVKRPSPNWYMYVFRNSSGPENDDGDDPLVKLRTFCAKFSSFLPSS